MKPERTVICTRAGTANEAEQALSARFGWPLIAAEQLQTDGCDFFLRFDDKGLTLFRNESDAPGGLCIDFDDPQLLRRTDDQLRQQNLCRAAGLKGKVQLHILDAMAGLGKDAWLLASAGANVHLLERAPVVYALLEDAFARRRSLSSITTSPLQRTQLQQADFFAVASELPHFDVVYLDPMFPPSNKNARAKKDMFLLQALLGEDECDEAAMLAAARKLARSRVVVKRAKLSPHLAGQRPDIEYKGSSNRYDVYLYRAGT